jgi:hypothetical protein
MRLHENGRELRRVFVTDTGAEAEALLKMIRETEAGVRAARQADDPATGFMFVLDSVHGGTADISNPL